MKPVIGSNSLWSIVAASSVLSKIILIGSSLILIVCFFIFIYKLLLLREKMQQVNRIKASLQSAESLNEILALGPSFSGTLPGSLINQGLKSLKLLLQRNNGSKQKLSVSEVALFEESIDQALHEVVQEEYRYTSFLSVSAAVAPLVGLFGTISGLIQTFIAIGQEKSTDITTIAPGIAEALVTTFAGLVVAIPAFVLFHYLIGRIRNFEYQLSGLMSHFEVVIKRMLVE